MKKFDRRIIMGAQKGKGVLLILLNISKLNLLDKNREAQ